MTLPDITSPHYCCSCGEIGAILCEYCKYNIVSDPFDACIVCLKPTSVSGSKCSECHAPYVRAWCAGYRKEGLKELINAYKFERVMSADRVFVELLDEILPELPSDIVFVPIPTIMPHVRVRGYAHTERIVKRLALSRGVRYKELLRRQTNTVQQGADRRQRERQARKAFVATGPIQNKRILLVDDVYTTGATVRYASQTLLEAGASEVWIAILSRQPLEKED